MDNYEYVKKLYKKQSDLTRISNYHGYFNEDCKDIIQELYIVLLKLKNINRYVDDNDEPNIYIIFIILKNLIYQDRKKRDRILYDDNDINKLNVSEDTNFDIDKFEFILEQIEKIDDDIEWFSKKIVEVYINDNHSIRSLSKATGITPHYIQPIIHKFKLKCREEFIKIKL